MRYFEVFPQIALQDQNNNYMIYTNIMARVNLIPSLINNPSIYYQYNIQEGDRPDIIATKYYNNPYRYWIFLYGNNIIDPFWDLPLTDYNFNVYLNDKYGASANANGQSVLAYTQTTPYQYQKVVTTTDSTSGLTTQRIYNTDYNTYANLPVNVVSTNYFPDGSSVSVTTSRQIQTIFDYELETNENKRLVNIIDKKYAQNMEQSLKSLMSN